MIATLLNIRRNLRPVSALFLCLFLSPVRKISSFNGGLIAVNTTPFGEIAAAVLIR
nr:MAG TPA: hypothetical protein [Caudoviricetes sp.]